MQQVKLFKHVEAEIRDLEREMNAWMTDLQKKGGRVVDVKGNIAPQTVVAERKSSNTFSPSDLFVIVLYETGE
jgi:hypothetical protein